MRWEGRRREWDRKKKNLLKQFTFIIRWCSGRVRLVLVSHCPGRGEVNTRSELTHKKTRDILTLESMLFSFFLPDLQFLLCFPSLNFSTQHSIYWAKWDTLFFFVFPLFSPSRNFPADIFSRNFKIHTRNTQIMTVPSIDTAQRHRHKVDAAQFRQLLQQSCAQKTRISAVEISAFVPQQEQKNTSFYFFTPKQKRRGSGLHTPNLFLFFTASHNFFFLHSSTHRAKNWEKYWKKVPFTASPTMRMCALLILLELFCHPQKKKHHLTIIISRRFSGDEGMRCAVTTKQPGRLSVLPQHGYQCGCGDDDDDTPCGCPSSAESEKRQRARERLCWGCARVFQFHAAQKLALLSDALSTRPTWTHFHFVLLLSLSSALCRTKARSLRVEVSSRAIF